MANDAMFDLADQLITLREEKGRIEGRLKKLNAFIEEVEYQLSGMMALSEVRNFSRAGATFYLTTKILASASADRKDQLYAAIKENGFGDLVYQTINANALSSFVKEQIQQNENVLPKWLEGLVNVYGKVTIGIRRTIR